MPPPRRSPRRGPASSETPHPDDQVPAIDDTLLVGVVVGAFGIQGEMKVRLETEVAERFQDGGRLLFVRPGGTPLDWVSLQAARPHKGHVLVRLPGVDTPEAAAALRGAEFRIPASQRRKLPRGSYYLYELEGLEVRTEAGEVLGHIVEIWQPGGADVYVVAKPGARRWMIPAVSEFIRRIDIKHRTMVVRVEEALQE